MESTIIQCYPAGSMQTNCYFIYKESRKEAIIVDPGGDSNRLQAIIERLELKPKLILLTHGHFDHIGAAASLSELFGIKIMAHEDEKLVIEDPEVNLSSMFGMGYGLSNVEYFKEDDCIEIGGVILKVIHTPGHTCGSCCFLVVDQSQLISGDTLFCQSVGRTDFPTGNSGLLIKSIREKLYTLDKDTVVYPGHGESTSIGFEIDNNMCV